MNLKAVYEKLPEFYKERVESEARYAAIDQTEEIVLGTMAATSLAITMALIIAQYPLYIELPIGIISIIVIPAMIPYTIISIAAEKRKDEMEEVLPDALLLISANIKSGLNVEKAFLLSARDEFGPLAEELRQTAMEMFGGKPMDEALNDLENRVKSELFSETVKLLRDGIESGGNTAKLLESSADDIRNSMELRKEISSNIQMYTIFIMMAAVVGAPLLFSISVYMSETTANMWSTTELSKMKSVGELGLSFQQPQVNTEFFQTFAVMAIVTINFFASLIMSEIKNANVKEGAKYVPILVSVSVALFYIIKGTLSSVMGGFT
ncbi:type II secretion system F family protein [Candidatus Nanohalococcus occultus]|uniref:Pilus assembly protein TadC n=1 Tax=Candidatus Nanohalococcus occultus TaxID=2978047 RepID=A0ABY8CDJ2_9ARCH|nr:Pilus assembly protein TadC [Candidatus Nanohaloarchaeota archaeon SVXNc]